MGKKKKKKKSAEDLDSYQDLIKNATAKKGQGATRTVKTIKYVCPPALQRDKIVMSTPVSVQSFENDFVAEMNRDIQVKQLYAKYMVAVLLVILFVMVMA